jgi:hypothetical protein
VVCFCVFDGRKIRVYDTFEECLQRWSESPWAPRGSENLKLIVSRGTEEIVDPSHGFVSGFRFRHDPKLKVCFSFCRRGRSSFLHCC